MLPASEEPRYQGVGGVGREQPRCVILQRRKLDGQNFSTDLGTEPFFLEPVCLGVMATLDAPSPAGEGCPAER